MEYDSITYQQISSTCVDDNWITYDLRTSRLVGLGVGISDIDGQESITSICPLQDTGICDDAEFTIDVRDMEA